MSKSIFRRQNSPYWWYRFKISGERVSKSTGILNTPENRELAEAYHDQRKAEFREKLKRVENGKLWQHAVIEFSSKTRNKKDRDGDIQKLRFLTGKFHDEPLSKFDDKFIKHAIESKVKFDEEGEPLAHNPTANRYLALISSVLHKAKSAGFIDQVPAIEKFGESKRRVRWITEIEADRLIMELSKNAEHLAAMANFTLATGLRAKNVRLLTWSQIDMQRKVAWVYADQAKGNDDIAIPLNADALSVLRGQIGKHKKFVFVYEGEPVDKCSTKAWKKAKERAGIDDFRWHDLRHTWASWHVQAGTSLQRLMELGAWKSYDMVLRYAHLCAKHLQDDAERVTRGIDKPALQLVKQGTH